MRNGGEIDIQAWVDGVRASLAVSVWVEAGRR